MKNTLKKYSVLRTNSLKTEIWVEIQNTKITNAFSVVRETKWNQIPN
jgi:hypothetical protein